MLKLTAVSLILLLSACAINKSTAPADWPQDIEITVHRHPDGVSMRNACGKLMGPLDGIFAMPYSCMWVDLCIKKCEVHVEAGNFSLIEKHELGHCAGKDHYFSTIFADLLERVKNGVCQQTSPDRSDDVTNP